MVSKKIILSILIIGTIATMAGAGTWAAFSDTAKSTGNTFTAGTLDLVVGGPSIPKPLNLANTFPGDTQTITIPVSNAGTIEGTLNLKAEAISDLDGIDTDAELLADSTPGATGELSKWTTIVIKRGSVEYYNGLVNAFPAAGINCGTLAGGSNDNIDVTYIVTNTPAPSTADNTIQGDKLTFDAVFTLTQL